MVTLSSTRELPAFTRIIPVLVGEGHRVFREGLKALLEEQGDIQVIGEAENGRMAVEMAQRLCPAVVLMDIAMPLLNGLEAGRQILKTLPSTKIIFLSLYNDDSFIQQARDLGAAGYLTKETSMASLYKGIRGVCKGQTFFNSPGIPLRDSDPSPLFREDPLKKNASHLSSREVEILQLIAESQGNKQIASELDISIKTVEKHRQSLMKKLDIHCAAGLTRFAVSAGIVESGAQLTLA